MSESARELTSSERREIKQLVTSMCANYDKEYGCLPLDCECYMLNKWWTGSFCKYFRNAVLPLNPELEASLQDSNHDLKSCLVCGQAIRNKSNRQKYCDHCAGKERRKRQREYMRKKKGDI